MHLGRGRKSAPSVRLVPVVRAALALGAASAPLACTGSTPEDEPPPVAAEALLRLDLRDGAVTGAEVLHVAATGVLTSAGRMDPEGELHLRWIDERGIVRLDGYRPDPRLYVAEMNTDETITGGIETMNVAEDLVVLPVGGMERGRLVVTLTSPDGTTESTDLVIDIPPETGSTAGALRAGLQATAPIEALTEMRDPRGTVTVLFVPHGYTNMDDFRAQARQEVEGIRQLDWFRDTPRISYWMMADADLSANSGAMCDTSAAQTVHRTAMLRALLEPFGDGDSRPKRSADIVVAVAPDAGCRSYAFFSRHVYLGIGDNFDRDGRTLAHELGHALGGLADNYVEAGAGSAARCAASAPRANVTDNAAAPRWSCLMQTPSPPTCPDGRPIGAYDGVYSCAGLFIPCQSCLMRSLNGRFCPVCAAQMGAQMNRRLFEAPTEDICVNGVDDDLDGSVDETCACEAADACATRQGCSACARTFPCGWSRGRNVCLDGSDTGSTDGSSSGNDWAWGVENCPTGGSPTPLPGVDPNALLSDPCVAGVFGAASTVGCNGDLLGAALANNVTGGACSAVAGSDRGTCTGASDRCFVPTGADRGMCVRPCGTTNRYVSRSTCPSGTRCFQLSGDGSSAFCFPDCSSDADCIPSSFCDDDGSCQPGVEIRPVPGTDDPPPPPPVDGGGGGGGRRCSVSFGARADAGAGLQALALVLLAGAVVARRRRR